MTQDSTIFTDMNFTHNLSAFGGSTPSSKCNMDAPLMACAFSEGLDNPALPTLVDDWLNQTLSQFLNPSDLFKSEVDLLQAMPSSPPATPGCPSSRESSSPQSSSAPVTPPPISYMPLFPDLTLETTNKQPARVVPVAPRPPMQLVPIMPKTALTSSQPSLVGKRKFSTKEQDEIALKRQKNTDAARRSRMKKLMKMETLQGRVTELEGDNAKLTTRIAVLETEKGALESKEKSLEERVRVLEAQLAEAHKALTYRIV